MFTDDKRFHRYQINLRLSHVLEIDSIVVVVVVVAIVVCLPANSNSMQREKLLLQKSWWRGTKEMNRKENENGLFLEIDSFSFMIWCKRVACTPLERNERTKRSGRINKQQRDEWGTWMAFYSLQTYGNRTTASQSGILKWHFDETWNNNNGSNGKRNARSPQRMIDRQ